MWSAVARLGLSFKKTLHAAEQDRLRRRGKAADLVRGAALVDADKLVFIDETGAGTKMTRLCRPYPARAVAGWLRRRSVTGKTTTFVALRCGVPAPTRRWCSMDR